MTDFEYELRRNKLIPAADRFANTEVGIRPKLGETSETWSGKWNRAFAMKMDELAREDGLIK